MLDLRTLFCAAVATTIASFTYAAPTVVHAEANTFVVTQNNTINSTSSHNTPQLVAENSPPSPLGLTFLNNFSGRSSNGSINAYVTGTDGDGAAFFLQSDGTAYYPPNPAAGIPPTVITQNIAIPLGAKGEMTNISLPNYISSGRIYFSVGTMQFAANNGGSGPTIVAPSFTNSQDANANINYGFVEFTWTAQGGVYSNLSYVDYIGLVISQLLSSKSSGTCQVKGLPSNAVSTVCSALKQQAAQDGQAWDQSCQTDGSGNVLRVLAPLHLLEVDSSALSGYYDSYVNQVWDHYSKQDLTITAGELGNFTGLVDSSGNMNFDQGGSFSKPSLSDILGCSSGPFSNPAGSNDTARLAIVPRLCAAFDRSTLLLDGGNVQPDGVDPSKYYSVSPTNHYSRIVHQSEVDGKGYAFSYDDVHPDGSADVSGLCNAPDPTGITFTIGGSSS